MVDTSWDVDKYRCEHESDEQWRLRHQFMLAHKHRFPEQRLVCLTQVFFNMEFLGCRYPQKTMDLVSKLASEVAKDFRESRKGKLKRTFVGAQDAAGAKAKGAKPPSGTNEGSESYKTSNVVDEGPSRKKQHVDQDEVDQEKLAPNVNEEGEVEFSLEEIKNLRDCSADLREIAKTFVMMIPIRPNSQTERDNCKIIGYNFPERRVAKPVERTKDGKGWVCEMSVNPLLPPSIKTWSTKKTKKFKENRPRHTVAKCIGTSQSEAKQKAAAIAVADLKKYCTYVEPNPEWFCDGGTPEFIKNRVPCQENPRTYLIMTKQGTGHITPEVADQLFNNFKSSSNEEMYFINEEYNIKEKNDLMGRSHSHNLGFRHFGSGSSKMLKDHHICIFKKKPACDIVEEAMKRGGKHPKYLIRLKDPKTSAKSPPRPNWNAE